MIINAPYEEPEPRVFIECHLKNDKFCRVGKAMQVRRRCVEVCEICPYIKACKEYGEYLASKNRDG